MTKTSRTMHTIARNYAVSGLPRSIGTKFGYGITESYMKRIFFEQGFNTNRKTWLSYLAEWEQYGLVIHDEDNGAYWFSMNATLEKMARSEARKLGIKAENIVFGERAVV